MTSTFRDSNKAVSTSISLLETFQNHDDMNIAHRAYEALQGILLQEGEYFVSTEKSPYFMVVYGTPTPDNKNQAITLLAEKLPEGEFQCVWEGNVADTKNLISSYMIAFPDAIVSLKSNYPVYLLSGPNWKRVFTLNALKEGISNKFLHFATAYNHQ